jgi:hypothetical protein
MLTLALSPPPTHTPCPTTSHQLMSTSHVHSVHVVSAAHAPLGQITSLDILRVLLSTQLVLCACPADPGAGAAAGGSESIPGPLSPLLRPTLHSMSAGSFGKPVADLAFVFAGTPVAEAMQGMERHIPPLTSLPVAVRPWWDPQCSS